MKSVGDALNRRELLRASVAIGAGAWLSQPLGASSTSINERMSGNFSPVHDPCIIKAGDTYHLFCTGHAGDANGLSTWWSMRPRAMESKIASPVARSPQVPQAINRPRFACG